MRIMCSRSGKISYNMASNVTHNANICVGVEMGVEDKEVQLQRKVPARPPRLRLKTEHYYDVKLPTYEESQKKYAKFMKVLLDSPEKQ